ncbi:MAG: preprotein translocase subunit YajC [Rhodocyclaceae bacterium]|nr:preprotein translocase subunit YajC [Rhodocyclaceae bacterium]
MLLNFLISDAHAQTAAAANDPTGGLMQFLPFAVMIAILYFMMIRPQMKKAKDHRALMESLQKGDEVITQGGLTGRIVKVGENYVQLEVAENTVVTVQKPAIGVVLPKGTLKSL